MRETLASGTAVEVVRRESDRAIVIVPDIGGLRPLFDDMVARLADETDSSVAAVEPFPGREQLSLEDRLVDLGGYPDERRLGDLVAAADLLGAAHTGVIGFCMGGMYVHKAAGTGRFHRGVSFYGMIRVPERWRGPGIGEPLDALAAPECCPVLAIIGTADPYTPAADVDALDALEHVTVVRYDGAEHGFVHDPDRPAHRPDDAADAWARTAAFLAG